MLGMGVMLGFLGGNEESVKALKSCFGKKITTLTLGSDDALHFTFSDGSKVAAFDDGQSCCESRYMRTDDNLEDFIGATFVAAELKDAPNMEDEYGDHEVQFLEIMTSNGALTMASHNEHNGYYGGFNIKFRAE